MSKSDDELFDAHDNAAIEHMATGHRMITSLGVGGYGRWRCVDCPWPRKESER